MEHMTLVTSFKSPFSRISSGVGDQMVLQSAQAAWLQEVEAACWLDLKGPELTSYKNIHMCINAYSYEC